jgi:molybdopterin-binding protein
LAGAGRGRPALGHLIRQFFITFFQRTFKEKFMSIQAINVRNQFRGKVREIIRGDVVSEVDVETPWGIVTSVITTRSVDNLELVVGSDVVALIKSTEVSIAKL